MEGVDSEDEENIICLENFTMKIILASAKNIHGCFKIFKLKIFLIWKKTSLSVCFLNVSVAKWL